MTIKAGGRVALIAATGLLVCVTGMSWTMAASDAAEQKSENVSTSKKLKQVRYYKRYAHRKYTPTAQKSSEENKPVEVAEAGLPSELPASVANANARMGHHHKHFRHHGYHKQMGVLKTHAAPKLAVKHIAPVKRG